MSVVLAIHQEDQHLDLELMAVVVEAGPVVLEMMPALRILTIL
jgi:hypothetical protein